VSSAPETGGAEVGEILCSPGLGLTCSACCPPIRRAGYDHADHRSSLRRLFRENRSAWLKGEAPSKPQIGFWCPGLGFLDDQGHGVGCLLHPAQNQGRDLRQPTGYADKCRREWCQEARCWSELWPGERRALLTLCADMDGLAFGSPRENPVRRLLAWGPGVAGAAARLGLGSRGELAALNWLEALPSAWGWLLGLVLEKQGPSVLTWPGLATELDRAVNGLRRGLGPRLPLDGGQLLGELCDSWEARLWRRLAGRLRARQEEMEMWRQAARQVVEAGQWR
jgi:hypothetical protein